MKKCPFKDASYRDISCNQETCQLWFGDDRIGECAFKSMAVSLRNLEHKPAVGQEQETKT